MASHQCILKDRDEIAERTMAFRFEKAADFQFKARQFVDAELTEPPEMDSPVRPFPIASAPYGGELLVAARVGNIAFKHVLPMGSFSLHKNPSEAAVFLVGGIGITRFS
jgi:ferredoxin-NADP reductase